MAGEEKMSKKEVVAYIDSGKEILFQYNGENYLIGTYTVLYLKTLF